MAKANDYRDQSVEELEATCLDLHKELYGLRNDLKINKKLEHPHKIKLVKRDIARILTVLNEKKKLAVGA